MSLKCPKCGEFGIDVDGRSKSFKCLYPDCAISLGINDYMQIASAILQRPFNKKDNPFVYDYPLPDTIANKVLELIYVIDNQRRSTLGQIDKLGVSEGSLRRRKKTGELDILVSRL